jgi:hypothetical protein
MSQASVEFEILRDGRLRVETHGTIGPECQNVFAMIEYDLGVFAHTVQPKAELHQACATPRRLVSR